MSKCCPTKKNSKSIDAKAILKEAGFSATSTKLKLIEIFSNSNSPLSSIDLKELIQDVDESTIFRNLKQFTEAGLLTEINIENGFKRFELTPKGHHHHHIKCNDCGKIDTIDICALNAFTKQLKKLGYKNISHKFEFFGTCKTCSAI